MAQPVRILAVGAAAPALRLAAADVASAWGRSGGKGQAAVCAPDEDTLTLAAEAAFGALAAGGIEAAGVDGLWWGTSRPPFAEGPSHAVLGAAIGLSHQSGGILASGSAHSDRTTMCRLRISASCGGGIPGPYEHETEPPNHTSHDWRTTRWRRPRRPPA